MFLLAAARDRARVPRRLRFDFAGDGIVDESAASRGDGVAIPGSCFDATYGTATKNDASQLSAKN